MTMIAVGIALVMAIYLAIGAGYYYDQADRPSEKRSVKMFIAVSILAPLLLVIIGVIGMLDSCFTFTFWPKEDKQ